MEEQNLISEEPQELSQMDAISGVFTEPGNTFESIAKFPKRNFWLLPVLILVLTSIVFSLLSYFDSEIESKMFDRQKIKLRERMQEKVKNGKMTQSEADLTIKKAEEFMDPNNPNVKGYLFIMIGFRLAFAIVIPFIFFFVICVFYMLFLQIIQSNFEFTNILNVIGLSLLVSSIGDILSIFCSILIGDLATVGPTIFLSPEKIGEVFHTILLKFDIFSVWFCVLASIGLVKIAKIKPIISYLFVFILWIIMSVFTALIPTFINMIFG
jgi:hypothetical protein